MKKEKKLNQDMNTEEKIKEAAKVLFQKQGFAGTKTRDIAESAGINHALLNYYFRSKQKLFNVIMDEIMLEIFPPLINILNEKETSLEEKVEKFVANFIDVNVKNDNLSFFVIDNIKNEGRSFPLLKKLNQQSKDSFFFEQFQEYAKTNKIPNVNPLQFIINITGLCVYPFLIKPMLMEGIGIPQNLMNEIIEERKRLIPIWVKQMLEVD